jgi:ribosomal-protein-alanine N-acetyltransferase
MRVLRQARWRIGQLHFMFYSRKIPVRQNIKWLLMMSINVLQTERLVLSQLSFDDAPFILELLNEPSFIKNIGDKKVRSIETACGYLSNGPMASYQQHGYGLYKVSLKKGHIPVGICGLVRRATLDDPDVGYAFLEKYHGRGFATESAGAVLKYGYGQLGLKRILAITSPDNEPSMNVLRKIGLRFERNVRLGDAQEESSLFVPAGTTQPSSLP